MIQKITDYSVFNVPPWLLTFLQDSNFVAILESGDIQLNELETALWDTMQKVILSVAEGAQLDMIGVLVGVDRNGLSDADYKIQIYFKFFLNLSCGEPETLINTLRVIYQVENSQINYRPEFPAKVVLWVDSLDFPGSIGIDLLYNLLPAGVGLIIGYTWAFMNGNIVIGENGNTFLLYV